MISEMKEPQKLGYESEVIYKERHSMKGIRPKTQKEKDPNSITLDEWEGQVKSMKRKK
jgi:hypothetical protein